MDDPKGPKLVAREARKFFLWEWVRRIAIWGLVGFLFVLWQIERQGLFQETTVQEAREWAKQFERENVEIIALCEDRRNMRWMSTQDVTYSECLMITRHNWDRR